MPIKVLEPEVISRIAAGEVVARPASAVKELVENALDAASSEITIEVEGGGATLIRVSDNGTGIPPDEVKLAFERHATSKVNDLVDLERISSLGFRGEALPSIAAVSEVDVVTRVAIETAGYIVKLSGGKVISEGRQGRAPGTTVTVKNLFRKIPARLKFLKSTATEISHITRVINQYSLAFPEVKFTLLLNGRVSLRTPGSGRLIDSITQVYGREVSLGMLDIIGVQDSTDITENPLVTLSGMVSSPNISRSNWEYLSFFVNRRWIVSRMLMRAVDEAYHGLLMTGRHPLAIIQISLPPDAIDVNIHPAKTEIKFQNEKTVFTAIQRAVRKSLVELAPVPIIESARIPYSTNRASTVSRNKNEQRYGPFSVFSPVEGKIPPVSSPTPMASLPALRILGQVSSSYIVAEGPHGIFVIDQHAAHERILFEKINEQQSGREQDTQGLLEPYPLELNAGQCAILECRQEDLAAFGFSIEPFGNRTFLVRAIPRLLYRKNWQEVIMELVDSVSGKETEYFREKLAVSIACHSAVRAGKVLADSEMRELIQQLERVKLPHSCPHGRPTMIRLDFQQLEKEFRRT